MKITRLGVLILISCFACNSEREAPNGLKLKVLRKGIGEYAVPGEFLITRMIVKDAKDSIWRDTQLQNLPMIIPVGDVGAIDTEKGIESAFRVMKKNDSVAIDIEARLLFKDQPLPPQVKPEDKVTFVFSVKEITDQKGIVKIQQELQAKQFEQSRKSESEQLASDTVAIRTHLSSKNIKATKDPSGVSYVIKKMGNGPKPVLSSTISFKYRGTFLESGSTFDESQAPVEYPLNQLIKGWQIVFQLFPKGTSATLYVPSTLGYGADGFPPNIPPNANLVFDVELVDFKN